MFHCTLVRGPGSDSSGPPLELTIESSPDCAGEDLQHEIAMRFHTRELTLDGSALSAMTVGVAPLVNGAILVDGGVAPGRPRIRATAEPPAPLMLVVHSGPGAGSVLPLRRGTYRIGRSHSDVNIPDADLSREHARLDVSDTAITIVDLDSANGTEVDGKRVRNAVVSTGSTIRCGNSTMSLVFGGTPALSGRGLEKAGQSVAEPLKIPRRAEATNRTALILTAGLPLIIGVGLAVITGMWMFLAFTAVSAISVLVPVISGRRQRRELKSAVTAAVQEDRERRRRAAPSVAEMVLSGPVMDSGRSTDTNGQHGVWLRIGTSRQDANVVLEPADPDFRPPMLGDVPLVLDPSTPITSVRGPRTAVNGLAYSIIMQLGGYPYAGRTSLLIHAPARLLPLAARYLRTATLTADSGTAFRLLEAAAGPDSAPGILVLMADTPPAGSDAGLVTAARAHGWLVLRFLQAGGDASGTDIEIGDRLATFRTGTSISEFIPDLVPEEVFNRYCRKLAYESEGSFTAAASVPESCSLGDVMPLGASDTSLRWATGKHRSGLAVPVGLTSQGVRMLDLEADGPHLLVAGTTGSGKSELLRSLTAALALSYPPDRINFLFIDFKGGSGLGPLSGLPHCVGILTDLTRHELDRALVSLRAEIRRREELLAAAQAPDLSAYRTSAHGPSAPLPHLVVVIDEFRMLVDDAPDALSELMRIAAIGRSLGVHLIMATQRPQGALTADIRANVTTSIALRVQSDMESADIINSKLAADIAVGIPGRAYLARGTEAPEEFQTASLAQPSVAVQRAWVTARLTIDAMGAEPDADGGDMTVQQELTPAEAAAPIVESTSALWAGMGGSAVLRPVAKPLPAMLTYARNDTAMASDRGADVLPLVPGTTDSADTCSVQLGWMDLPHEQRLARLEWKPSAHGHLGLVGGSAGGVPEAMMLAVHQLKMHRAESHFYILDADGLLNDSVATDRVGAVAGLHELRRGVRVLERIAREISLRLSRPKGAPGTPLVLVISGWGSWVSAFRAGPLTWAEDVVQDIVRDGSKAGVTVLISGERELVTSRFFATVPNRVYFPTGASEDSRLAWPKLPDTAPVPGRAVVFGALAVGRPSVCQFYALPVDGTAANQAASGPPPVRVANPFRVEPLPARIHAEEVLARLHTSVSGPAPTESTEAESRPGRHRRLYVGLGGDELDPVSVRLPSGSVLAVLGGHASGKTSLMRTLPALNPWVPGWLRPDSGSSTAQYWADTHANALSGLLDKDAIVLADDADLLSPATNQQLLELHNMGWTVVLTAGFSPTLMQRVPLALSARGYGTGMLIAPRSLMDGDFFGLRFELETNPPPGRSVLISDGRAMAVQLAFSAAPSAAGRDKVSDEDAVRGQEVTRPHVKRSQ